MITPLPKRNATSLLEAVRPTGWENLAGPFHWIDVVSELEEHPEYGLTLRILPVGKIGRLAESYAETGDSPHPNILVSGPGGIGKSVFFELLARTHLATKREAITYETKNGDTVTLINDKTGLPFYLNPVDDGPSRIEYVRKAIANSSNKVKTEVERRPTIQFFNAGPMGKGELDELVQSLRYASLPTLHGTARRVVIISEFDNLTKIQVPSLKSGLDPSNAPKGLLMLFDTNYLDKVRKTMGEAGMERFHVIYVGPWSIDVLTDYAEEFTSFFNIQFDYSSFHDINPIDMIVNRASGSIRELLRVIDTLRAPEGSTSIPLTLDYLEQLLSEEPSMDLSDTAASWEFINQVANRREIDSEMITRFALRRIKDGTSIATFVNGLSYYLLQNYPHVFDNADTSWAMGQLFTVLQHDGQPIPETIWATIIGPLTTIAEAIVQETTHVN